MEYEVIMAFRVKGFLRPKQGERPETCADALAYSLICRGTNLSAADEPFGSADADVHYGRFAVADGVSEALRSGEWARALCGAFVEAGPDHLTADEFTRWAEPQRRTFDAQLRAWADAKYAQNKKYWSLPNKAYDEGSQATFLGLRLQEPGADGAGAWSAISVGDCCLTWWNQTGMLRAWPADNPDEFGLTPGIVGTKGIGRGAVLTSDGHWEKDSVAVLTSDAMSVWLLRHHHETNICSWREWDEDAFDAWLAQERDTDRLRDDDCVVLFVWWEIEQDEPGDAADSGKDERSNGDDEKEPDSEIIEEVRDEEQDLVEGDAQDPLQHRRRSRTLSVLDWVVRLARSFRLPLVRVRNR